MSKLRIPSRQVEPTQPSVAPSHDRPTLLIVDDEPDILELYLLFLDPQRRSRARAAESEYRLVSATSGEDALVRAREIYASGGRIEAGFFDMKMPGINGVETIEKLLAIDPNMNCCIVSAYVDHPLGDVAKVFGPGHEARWSYISKPFAKNEIMQGARNMISEWHQRRTSKDREASLLSSATLLQHAAEAKSKELEEANRKLREKQEQLEAALNDLTTANRKLQAELAYSSHMERELHMAHKLEAVGQLAAGIAHEISTPTQYIGNNIYFLSQSFDDIQGVMRIFHDAFEARGEPELCKKLLVSANDEAEKVDLNFVYEEIPESFQAAGEGIATIASIVDAMRTFAHPDSVDKELGDINRAIESTLTVSHSEYRYVAKVDLDLGDIPMIPCLLGGLNQVFLNLVVNAAHAISDSGKAADTGRITIRTWTDFSTACLCISITDNGVGLHAEAQDKMFDLFFTTKDVGRGTGQGLAIAHDIVVEKHAGRLEGAARSDGEEGTTFLISLPL